MKTRITRASLLILLSCFYSLAQEKNKESPIEIPFDFYRNEIIVQVKINGKGPFSMMIDTGTDPSAVDLTTAKEIGLKLDSTGRQGTGTGTDKNLAYVTRFPLVEVGSLGAKDIWAAAIDLSKVSARLGRPLHGVLGHSLLNGRVVQIDYPNRVVRFYSKTPFPKSANESNTSKRTVLHFRYKDNVLVDEVLVNGRKMIANFDTGSNGNFALTPAAVTYLGIEEEVQQGEVVTDVGYNGQSENRKGKLNNVTVGGISVDAPEVTFFGKGIGHDQKPWGINIGNVFLKDFVMTIDYKSKLIVLEKP